MSLCSGADGVSASSRVPKEPTLLMVPGQIGPISTLIAVEPVEEECSTESGDVTHLGKYFG